MDGVELMYDFFEDRAHASSLIRQRRPAAAATLAVFLGATSLYVARSLAGKAMLPFGWPALVLAVMWQVVVTFATAGLLHLILELGGAKGDARALFVHLGFSELTWTAAVPLVLVCQAAFSKPTWSLRLVFFAVGLWALSYKARGIRDEYGIGGGVAWLALGLPYLAALGFVLLAAFLSVLGLAMAALSNG